MISNEFQNFLVTKYQKYRPNTEIPSPQKLFEFWQATIRFFDKVDKFYEMTDEEIQHLMLEQNKLDINENKSRTN